MAGSILENKRGAGEISHWSLPNALTMLRFILIPWQCYYLATGHPLMAFVLYLQISLLDLLDGYLARVLNRRTLLGAILDPIADKFLITSNFLVLIYLNIVPLWFLFLVFSREFILFLGFVLLQIGKKRVPWRSLTSGRWTTLALNVTVMAFIVDHYFWFPRPLLFVFIGHCLVLIPFSLWKYVQHFFVIYNLTPSQGMVEGPVHGHTN